MKKSILLFFISLSIYTVLGQENTWAPIGTKWYYEVTPLFWYDLTKFQELEIVGDTVINSKECAIIQRLNLLNLCDNSGREYEYVHKSEDTIYWWNPDIYNFTILYDFSASKGDSWEIVVANCPLTIIIDSVSSILINEKEHRILYVTSQPSAHYFSGKIIENIGHTTSFFPKDIYWECQEVGCDSDQIDGFRCYLENEQLIYSEFDKECDAIYYAIDIKEFDENSLNVYPNPVKDFLHLDFKETIQPTEIYFQIYNTSGQLLKENTLAETATIPFFDIPTGLYCVRLFVKNNLTLMSQFKILKK